ncbi:MAG: hypothetical protein ACREQX_00505 [Candidatus Binataceae bacterium]
MHELTFVDANSTSPRTKLQIEKILSRAGIPCLDGTFFGPANRIGPDNILALSGPGADKVARLLHATVEVWPVGTVVGRASALKMALGIMTKALCALFLEMVCASAAEGQLASTLKLMRRLYPGTMGFLERSLPTYPAHVARKTQELGEVLDWLHELGQSGAMTHGALEILERLRLEGFDSRSDWCLDDLLRRFTESALPPSNRPD